MELMQQNRDFKRLLLNWVQQLHMTYELFKIFEEFICKLNAARTNINEVNELLHQLWSAQNGAVESGQLTPYEDSLRQHIMRTNYQSVI